MSRIRKSFSGAAVATYLTAPMLITDMTFIVNGITNWPNTVTGPFVVTVDRGLSTEEKILCSSYTGMTVTVSQRGYDGTTAQAHAVGAAGSQVGSVVCSLDADTVDGANDFMHGNGSVAPTASAVGDTSANGTSLYSAAADHKHAREAFGAAQTQAVAAANSDGVQTTLARSDHAHAGVTSYAGRQGAINPSVFDIQGLFSADQQIFSGTGSGTGERIDLLLALCEYFTAANQVIVGSGNGTGTVKTYLDTAAGDIAPVGNAGAAVAGSKGMAADAGHTHAQSLFNVEGNLAGTAPPAVATGGYLVQAGTITGTTNASGQLNHTYPSAFPHGLLTLVITNGDSAAVADLTIDIIHSLDSVTGFAVSLRSNNVLLNTGLVRLNYIAIGY